MAHSRSDQAVLRAFGKHVRKARKSRGWTQEVLAEHARLNRTYIGGIERGERNPALLSLNKLAVALGQSFAGFFPYSSRIGRGR
jgi:transcriptional regulator with XRE-family HTH domain